MTNPSAPRRVPDGATPDGATPDGATPDGATPEGDGIVVGNGPVRIDAYIDFLCPYCRQFELSSASALATLIANGEASVAYHPMNFLDEASTANYSTRAAAASGCAADQGRFTEYAHALFEHQPPEGGPGLSDAELAGLGPQAGLTGSAFTGCLSGAPYLEWPSYVTERATAAGVTGTPTVLVAAEEVEPEPEAITAAVARAVHPH